MSLLSFFGISDALAAATNTAAPQSAAGGLLSMLPMLIIIVAVFYFLFVRPQSKRTQEHKNLMAKLAVGDELVTTGGMVGKVSKLKDNFLVLNVGNNVEIVLQKHAIAAVLPKGTLETVK